MSFLKRTALTGFVLTAACRTQAVRESSPAATMDHSAMTAESHAAMHPPGSTGDPAYAEMQKRGGMAMGVDQYASKHTFDITNDGGRIALQNDADDSVAIAQIRAHMRLIQHAFEAGDFSTPAFVHSKDMPGTATMSRKRSLISYIYNEIPRGGEVRIVTSDPEARKAIEEFLRAQRSEHHATGSA